MPPRLKLLSARKALPVCRPTPPSSVTLGGPQRSLSILSHYNHHQSRTPVGVQRRWNSSESGSDAKHTGLGEPGQPSRMKGPTEDALPHVSEEAAATDRIMSKEKSCDGVPSSPELEQGTPVSEVCLVFFFQSRVVGIVADGNRSCNAIRKLLSMPPRLCRI